MTLIDAVWFENGIGTWAANMEYYTRATIIHSDMKIRRERALPKSGEVVVNVGNEVSPNLVVARTPLETHFAIVDASDVLGVDRDDVSEYMLVEPEAIVDIETVLAQKKQLMRSKQVLAPVEGVFFGVVNGRVVIQQTSEWLEQRAMVSGRVVSFVADRGVIIETHGSLIQGAWGSGKEGFGQLKVVARNESRSLSKGQINSDVNGMVLAAGRIDNEEVLELAVENNVQGIIAGSMPATLWELTQTMPFPIFLSEGFGKQSMSTQVFSLLKESDGNEISLFCAYEAKLGQRPEVVLPKKLNPNSPLVSAAKPIRVGQDVRLLRAPYVGQSGKVEKIYNLSQVLATGAKAQGANVRLADGNVVFIPYANFDILV